MHRRRPDEARSGPLVATSLTRAQAGTSSLTACRATNRNRSPRNTDRVHSTGRPPASRPVRCTSRIGSPVSTPSRSSLHRVGQGRLDDVLHRGELDPERLVAGSGRASRAAPVDRPDPAEVRRGARSRARSARPPRSAAAPPDGSAFPVATSRCALTSSSAGCSLICSITLPGPLALRLQILRERGELADLHELGLRDERAAALGAFQPAVDHQFGDGLADRRAGGRRTARPGRVRSARPIREPGPRSARGSRSSPGSTSEPSPRRGPSARRDDHGLRQSP